MDVASAVERAVVSMEGEGTLCLPIVPGMELVVHVDESGGTGSLVVTTELGDARVEGLVGMHWLGDTLQERRRFARLVALVRSALDPELETALVGLAPTTQQAAARAYRAGVVDELAAAEEA